MDEEGNVRSGFVKVDKPSVKNAVDLIKPLKEEELPSAESNDEAESIGEPEDVDIIDNPQSLIEEHHATHHPVIRPNTTIYDDNARYLAWNAVGKIVQRRDPVSGIVSVDVDFADVRKYRPVRFTDDYGFEFAFLGESGCVFGNDRTVVYMPFSSWAMKVNTVLELQECTRQGGERVVSVACNTNEIFVLTTCHFRVITCSGVQSAIYPVANPLGLIANDRLGALIVVEGQKGIAKGLVYNNGVFTPTGLLSAHPITWLGSSLLEDGGCFGCMDVDQRFYVLKANAWILLHQTNTLQKSESVWPVFFTSTHLFAVNLHDFDKHPSVLPVPFVSEHAFTAPLMVNPFEQSIMKQTNLLYTYLHTGASMPAAADKNTLELIQVPTLDTCILTTIQNIYRLPSKWIIIREPWTCSKCCIWKSHGN